MEVDGSSKATGSERGKAVVNRFAKVGGSLGRRAASVLRVGELRMARRAAAGAPQVRRREAGKTGRLGLAWSQEKLHVGRARQLLLSRRALTLHSLPMHSLPRASFT